MSDSQRSNLPATEQNLTKQPSDSSTGNTMSQTIKRRRDQSNQSGPTLRSSNSDGVYVYPKQHRAPRKQHQQMQQVQIEQRSDEEDNTFEADPVNAQQLDSHNTQATASTLLQAASSSMSNANTAQTMNQNSGSASNPTGSKGRKQDFEQTWSLGETKYTRTAIKEFFQDKQIFNQANIFTRKTDDDLFEDSDEEVQEEGLVTQIHKRNMQDVYDMTPLDKKFTFLWNEFFIAQEKKRIKQKIPIKRTDIYSILQLFIRTHTVELSQLYNQFVIHLFTLQDNGIIDSTQVTNSLKFLKQILDTK